MKRLWLSGIILVCCIWITSIVHGHGGSFTLENRINISSPAPTPENHQHPRWSYDQKFLAFETLSQNEIHIYIYAFDDNKFIEVIPKELTSRRGGHVTYDLRWSAKSTSNYYCIAGIKDENIQLCRGIADPKSKKSNANNVLNKKVAAAAGSYTFVGFPKISTHMPENDAEILACIIGKEGDLDLYSIWYKYDTQSPMARFLGSPRTGGSIQEITNISNTKDVSEFQPSFSADSKRMIFAGDKINNNDIYIIENLPNEVMTVDTSTLKRIQLTSEQSIQSHPSFCPTGGYIAFLSEEGHPKVKGLWIMDEDGRNQREIAPAVESTDLTGYSWHKDGRYIFYVKNDVKQLNPVAYYDLQENKEFILETGTAMNSSVVVSPNGDRIAFCAKGLKDSPNLTWSTVFYGDLILK